MPSLVYYEVHLTLSFVCCRNDCLLVMLKYLNELSFYYLAAGTQENAQVHTHSHVHTCTCRLITHTHRGNRERNSAQTKIEAKTDKLNGVGNIFLIPTVHVHVYMYMYMYFTSLDQYKLHVCYRNGFVS